MHSRSHSAHYSVRKHTRAFSIGQSSHDTNLRNEDISQLNVSLNSSSGFMYQEVGQHQLLMMDTIGTVPNHPHLYKLPSMSKNLQNHNILPKTSKFLQEAHKLAIKNNAITIMRKGNAEGSSPGEGVARVPLASTQDGGWNHYSVKGGRNSLRVTGRQHTPIRGHKRIRTISGFDWRSVINERAPDEFMAQNEQGLIEVQTIQNSPKFQSISSVDESRPKTKGRRKRNDSVAVSKPNRKDGPQQRLTIVDTSKMFNMPNFKLGVKGNNKEISTREVPAAESLLMGLKKKQDDFRPISGIGDKKMVAGRIADAAKMNSSGLNSGEASSLTTPRSVLMGRMEDQSQRASLIYEDSNLAAGEVNSLSSSLNQSMNQSPTRRYINQDLEANRKTIWRSSLGNGAGGGLSDPNGYHYQSLQGNEYGGGRYVEEKSMINHSQSISATGNSMRSQMRPTTAAAATRMNNMTVGHVAGSASLTASGFKARKKIGSEGVSSPSSSISRQPAAGSQNRAHMIRIRNSGSRQGLKELLSINAYTHSHGNHGRHHHRHRVASAGHAHASGSLKMSPVRGKKSSSPQLDYTSTVVTHHIPIEKRITSASKQNTTTEESVSRLSDQGDGGMNVFGASASLGRNAENLSSSTSALEGAVVTHGNKGSNPQNPNVGENVPTKEDVRRETNMATAEDGSSEQLTLSQSDAVIVNTVSREEIPMLPSVLFERRVKGPRGSNTTTIIYNSASGNNGPSSLREANRGRNRSSSSAIDENERLRKSQSFDQDSPLRIGSYVGTNGGKDTFSPLKSQGDEEINLLEEEEFDENRNSSKKRNLNLVQLPEGEDLRALESYLSENSVESPNARKLTRTEMMQIFKSLNNKLASLKSREVTPRELSQLYEDKVALRDSQTMLDILKNPPRTSEEKSEARKLISAHLSRSEYVQKMWQNPFDSVTGGPSPRVSESYLRANSAQGGVRKRGGHSRTLSAQRRSPKVAHGRGVPAAKISIQQALGPFKNEFVGTEEQRLAVEANQEPLRSKTSQGSRAQQANRRDWNDPRQALNHSRFHNEELSRRVKDSTSLHL